MVTIIKKSRRCKNCGRFMKKVDGKMKCFANHENMEHAIYKRHCNFCGKYYEGYGKSYCSNKCNSEAVSPFRKGHTYWKHPKSIKTQFKKGLIPWSKGNDSRIEIICKTCEKKFKALPSAIKNGRKYCSNKCMGIGYYGSGAPAWKGGITKFHLLLRGRTNYKEWRNNIFERDKFTCQDCGDNRGGNLNAHHILPFSEYPKFRLDLNNGVTLCEPCHITRHTEVNNYGNNY